MLLRCVVALALVLVPAALGAQVEGRWALALGGGVTGRLRGELVLARRGDELSGTIWLEGEERPVDLLGAHLADQDELRFETDVDGGLQFRGSIRGGVLRGTAHADTGAVRPWAAARLQDVTEFYPTLPRFTQREILLGVRPGSSRLPGAWVAAARALPADDAERYRELARASGMAPLDGADLQSVSVARALGRANRDELVAASQRTLAEIEQQLPSPGARAAFDRIFRPRGALLTDLRDAAQHFATARLPGLTADDAVPGLRALGWIDSSVTASDAVVDALYRLRVLEATDSGFAAVLTSDLQRARPAEAPKVTAWLDAFRMAERWHAAAVQFLLLVPWIGGDSAASPLMLAASGWEGVLDSLPIPEVRGRHFSYPQAVPRYGIPDPLFDRLYVAENWAAGRWLERHGRRALLLSARQAAPDFGPEAWIDWGEDTVMLTTVRQQAMARTSGFLEPADVIEVDPSYVPLLALGAALHEWQHLAFERVRRLRIANDTGDIVALHAPDAWIAEGVAEWRTSRVLEQLAQRFPLLAVGEREKRLRIARSNPDEPHVLGYLLVGALAAAVPDEQDRLGLLLAASNDPAVVMRSELVDGWQQHASAQDLELGSRGGRALVPEMTFTLEDGFPDVIRLRITTRAP
ncbi:MAG TPA: hypothetical protein VFS94_00930 [Gemmatimonadales bacterium]|nr:hypothetical protein [Gemmatimonadales bacterium]